VCSQSLSCGLLRWALCKAFIQAFAIALLSGVLFMPESPATTITTKLPLPLALLLLLQFNLLLLQWRTTTTATATAAPATTTCITIALNVPQNDRCNGFGPASAFWFPQQAICHKIFDSSYHG